MARLIIIQDNDYERQYRESMDFLNGKYHDQPTHLRDIPYEEGDSLMPPTAKVSLPGGRTPIGKTVI